MYIRKAKENDINSICGIYSKIHTAEECGKVVTGWIRGIYPTENTAHTALKKGTLYIMEDSGEMLLPEIFTKSWDMPK